MVSWLPFGLMVAVVVYLAVKAWARPDPRALFIIGLYERLAEAEYGRRRPAGQGLSRDLAVKVR